MPKIKINWMLKKFKNGGKKWEEKVLGSVIFKRVLNLVALKNNQRRIDEESNFFFVLKSATTISRL